MIFRTGTETVSDLVMLADNGAYSHVGMLIYSPEGWKVLHATPEEMPGQGNKVVLDSLDFFIAPERSQRYHVFHVQATQAQTEQAVQWAMAQLGKPFTMLDPEGVYCTTLIWKAWQYADVDLKVEFTPISIPLLRDGQFLLPSGLIKSPLVSSVSATLP
ncbi:MAG: YiiX/YebB-like N1pC/P60 family cysteine hydrolase [Saezia sp.]